MRDRQFISVALVVAFLLLGTMAVEPFLRPAEVPVDESAAAAPAHNIKVVTAGLLKPHFHVGERISITQRLYNLGDNPVTIWGVGKFHTLKVYDEQGQVVFTNLPWSPRPESLVALRLDPGEIDRAGAWSEETDLFLMRPGRFRLVGWAELSLTVNFVHLEQVHAEPVWIEVVTGKNVGFWPVNMQAGAATPSAVKRWVEGSRKFGRGNFANAKEYDGKQYLFISGG